MRLFSATLMVTLVTLSYGRPQQQAIDPAYLRQYYQQLAQNTGAQPAPDAAPIYESESRQDAAPRYLAQGQQIRIKDTVNEQIQRSQQPAAYQAPQVRQYQPQPQQQQQYQIQPHQQPQQAYKAPQPKPRPQQYKGKLAEAEDPDYDDANQSYQFGFDVKDDEFTNYQNRKEQRDGNVIKGSYSVVDSDGFIRTVKYTADPKEGFRAEVIREPTDIVVKVPVQKPDHDESRAQPQQHHHNHNQLKQQQPQQFHQQAQPQYIQASQQIPAGAYRVQQQPKQHQPQPQQPQYHQYQ